MMVSKCKSYAYRLNSSNRSKGFTEVYAFNLSIALSYEASFVPDDLTIFVEFAAEDPFSPDDIVDSRIRSLDKLLDIIKLELKKFVLHSLNPLWFLKCFSDFQRF